MRNRDNYRGKKTLIGGGNDSLAAKEIFGGLLDVFVTTTRKVCDDDIFLSHGARDL